MIDKQSDIWGEVTRLLDAETQRVQKAILSQGITHDQSNYYRGYYAALLKVSALPEPKELFAQGDNYE